MRKRFAFAALLLSVPLSAQDRKAKGDVDPIRVDQAIDKGIAYLKRAGAESKPFFWYPNTDELTLLALLADGVSLNDPVFNKLFTKMMSDPLDNVYKVSLQ